MSSLMSASTSSMPPRSAYLAVCARAWGRGEGQGGQGRARARHEPQAAALAALAKSMPPGCQHRCADCRRSMQGADAGIPTYLYNTRVCRPTCLAARSLCTTPVQQPGMWTDGQLKRASCQHLPDRLG